MQRRVLSALCALCVFLLLLTASIGLPIYIRPFYYAHIEAFDLPGRSGYTAEEIREAYDAVLDYLTLPGREFSCGILAFSPEGESHFADCLVLFNLNRNVLLISGGVLAVLLLLGKKYGPYRLGKRSAAWWAGLLALILPLVLGGLAALDFDRAFVIFHQIFFPGKSNWLFDWRTDPVILILPQEFFRNCAILIGAGLVVFSLSLLIFSTIRDKKARTS
jgi:integral membrane protein (TIGR01906 family)